ncbi:Ectonucleoside triphosphate diphosphohydrolase 8, partial [Opisthocomus hoazin]
PLPPQYGLVFDAGSTHTALYIYRWPTDKENGTGIVSQVEACAVTGERARTWPSLSPAPAQLGDASAGRPQCLSGWLARSAEASWEAPKETDSGESLHLREPSSNRGIQSWARNLAPTPFIMCGVLFPWGLLKTSAEVPKHCWVSAGYWAGQCSFTGQWTHPPAEDTVGALDLGGASTQIAFLPGTTIDDSSTRAVLRLYGTSYSIYTHSYLCYGQKQALKMLMASLHQGSPSPQQISHPCYPEGYQENVTTAELYDSPCVRAPSTPSPAQVLTVTGTGDPVVCSMAIQRLFNFSCGANRTCGFNGVYQPPVRGQFFAFSGLYHSLHIQNLTGGQPLSSVNATIWQFCASSWDKVQKEFPTTNRTHLRDACAASSYALTLLLQGYKFNHTTWLNIRFVRQVANVDVGWTLGYMLNLTSMIPSETPQRVVGLQRSKWIAATVLLAIMLILIFCLLAVICCQKNSGYESL